MCKIRVVAPMMFSLWNGETWSDDVVNLKSLDTFHYKTIRRGLKKNNPSKGQKIRNEQLQLKFDKKCVKHLARGTQNFLNVLAAL